MPFQTKQKKNGKTNFLCLNESSSLVWEVGIEHLKKFSFNLNVSWTSWTHSSVTEKFSHLVAHNWNWRATLLHMLTEIWSYKFGFHNLVDIQKILPINYTIHSRFQVLKFKGTSYFLQFNSFLTQNALSVR